MARGTGADAPIHPTIPEADGAIGVGDGAFAAHLEQASRIAELLGELALVKVGSAGAMLVDQSTVEEHRAQVDIQVVLPGQAADEQIGEGTDEPVRVRWAA